LVLLARSDAAKDVEFVSTAFIVLFLALTIATGIVANMPPARPRRG
jgi:hypothetical protein